MSNQDEPTGPGPRRRYVERTDRSRALYDRARERLPGGNTRTTVFHQPYPSYIADSEGCRVVDIDGNEHVDFFNNAASLIHGHAPPEVLEQAREAMDRGTAPGGPTESEVEWAEHLCDRLPAIERVRFTNSGTEATMNAMRAVRAYTGNDVVAKFEGIYHGTQDDAKMSIDPPASLRGPPDAPNTVPDSAGIPEGRTDEVLVLPFNDADSTIERLRSRREDLAGVFVAPYMGSAVVPADERFLARLREFTDEHDVPLVFDEVISFRVAHGGAHAALGVEPDLVTLGKIIGGSFPVGAFGGRADIMTGFDPRVGAIPHGGTFNGNPVTATAGLAALERYTPGEVERLNDLASSLADRCESVADDHGVAVAVNTAGSLFNIYLSDAPVCNYRDAAKSPGELERQLYFALLDRGVRVVPKLFGSLSTPMDETHVETFVTAFDEALGELYEEFEMRGLTV